VKHAIRAALTVFIIAGFACAACAQSLDQKMPEQTKAIYVAMLFEKFKHPGGDAPDFEEWVRKSPDYDNAQLFERPGIVLKNSKELKATYDLMTATEPVVVMVKAHISSYSSTAKGFLVENFQARTFFDYGYLGKRYAVVPNGIEKYQWLKAVPEEVNEIMRESDNGHAANLVISLTPIQADPKPMKLNGQEYYLIMGDISKIEMWSKDNKRVVWDDKMNAPASVRSQILDMFHH
jgi:hypothetical protein